MQHVKITCCNEINVLIFRKVFTSRENEVTHICDTNILHHFTKYVNTFLKIFWRLRKWI